MIYFKEVFQYVLAFCIIWLLYKDSKRIFKAFFIHLERKLLIVHLMKLGLVLLLIYKMRRYLPLYEVKFVFVCMLLLLFLSLLSLKQIEFRKNGTINSKYKTFEYGSKLAAYLLYLLAVIVNIGDIKTKKNEIKQKSKEILYVAIFPVQKYIMVSITGLEFTKRKDKFITAVDLKEIESKLRPGDILLKRNDWQATNLGISGFWTHTGLYVGSLEELDAYFSDIVALDGKRFSEKLKEVNEKIYTDLMTKIDLTVIEAIEEGVVVKPLSNIAKVDYFSALRPRISKEEKMNAIFRAFSFVGRPYDFFLDLKSNDAFICTAVIYKSFETSITFEVEKKLGRSIVFPNSVVKKFAQERKKENKELDFVLFYDLDLKTRKAHKSTEFQFAKSYKRNISYYRKRDILKYVSTILEFK